MPEEAKAGRHVHSVLMAALILLAPLLVLAAFATYAGDCKAPLKKWFLTSCADYRAKR